MTKAIKKMIKMKKVRKICKLSPHKLKFILIIIVNTIVNTYLSFLLFSILCRFRNIRLENLCASCKSGGKLIACDVCPNRYHLECVEPPLSRAPRGRWSCTKCKEKRRNATKGNGEITTEEYTNKNVLRALFFCYNSGKKFPRLR